MRFTKYLLGLPLAFTWLVSSQPTTTSSPLITSAPSATISPSQTTTAISSTSTTTRTKVDTILDTFGVWTTEQVEAARLQTFCFRSTTTLNLCLALQTTVRDCIDLHNASCTDDEERDLFVNIVTLDPCLGVLQDDELVRTICGLWITEARRCAEMKRRGMCSKGHVRYLLRGMRDFLGLRDGRIGIGQVEVW